jgi:IS30 family transposase
VVLRKESGCHLATFVEQRSRAVLICKIPDKKAVTMGDTIIAAFSRIPPKLRKTLTVDKGSGFMDWPRVDHMLNVKVYFSDPYSLCQRAINETPTVY